MRIYLTLLLLANFSLTFSSSADLIFKRISVEKGLSHTDVTSVVQDSSGFMYLGTYSGLSRYDGIEIVSYKVTDYGLRNVYFNRISSLYNDGHQLWVGTQGGVIIFDLHKQNFHKLKFRDGLKPGASIIQHNVRFKYNKHLWITRGGDAYAYTIKNDSVIGISDLRVIFKSELGDQQILNLAPYSKGIIIYTNTGLYYLSMESDALGEIHPILEHSAYLSSDNFNNLALLLDHQGALWLTTNSKLIKISLNNLSGLPEVSDFKVLNPASFIKETKGEVSYLFDNCNNIYEDSNNDIWLSTFTGLVKLERGKSENEFRFFRFEEDRFNNYSISSNKVTEICETFDGSIFVGTFGGGVNYFERSPKPFKTLKPFARFSASSFSQSFVRAVYEQGNKLWIGTVGAGIVIYDFSKDTYKIIDSDTKPGLLDNNIRSIIEDNDGNIWIATLGGISIINKSLKLRHITSENSNLPSNSVQNLAIDRYGRVWAGFWGQQIVMIKRNIDGSFNCVEQNLDILNFDFYNTNVNSIYSDIEKNELIISTNNGILRVMLDEYGDIAKALHHKSHIIGAHSLQSNYVWPIQKYNDSIYWIGTLGGGFSEVVFSNDSMFVKRSFTSRNGAPFDDVECMLIDNQDKLWIAGSGLSRFDPKTGQFWNFDANDGLQGYSFKIGGAHKGHSGKLYFGGTNGMNYFYPSEIEKNTYSPRPGFTKLEIHNQAVHPGQKVDGKVVIDKELSYLDELVLKPVHNEFAISFSAFHFANPEKTKFKYKLEGYDSEWKYTSALNSKVFYSNLAPDYYTLKVQAYNNDDIISDTTAELSIVVLPPWYRTVYAFVGYFIFLLVIIFGSYRIFYVFIKLKSNLQLKEVEEKKQEELHQMKLRFFTNISHELRTPLSLILSPVERLNQNSLTSLERKKYLNIISRNVNRILQLVNELLDFRKAETGSMKLKVVHQDILKFMDEIVIGFSEIVKPKGIDFKFVHNDIDRFIWFDPQHLEKIAYNLLSNSVKNTNQGGSISIEVTTQKSKDTPFKHSFKVEGDEKFSNYIYLKFRDTGIGITEKSLPDIFNRFYQIEDSNNEKHLGSGIGLAYVKSLVLIHKGYISVSSERDQGSEFVVALPLGENCYKETEKSKELISKEFFIEENTKSLADYSNTTDVIESFLDKKLLIVEDNIEVRNFLKEEFSSKFSVLEASNGFEALDIIKNAVPDIIVTDVMMPKMDGVEFTKKVKSDQNLRRIPLIMLTARNNVEQELEGVVSGADLYLRKPFSIRILELYIRNLLVLKKDRLQINNDETYKEIREQVKNNKEKDFYNKTIDIIIEHLDDVEFSVDHLVSEVAMGRTMFYQRIKKVSGMSAKELIRSVRMKKASELLATSDVTVSEVKDMVGFGSMSHFTQCFKKYYNCTPSEYVKRFES